MHWDILCRDCLLPKWGPPEELDFPLSGIHRSPPWVSTALNMLAFFEDLLPTSPHTSFPKPFPHCTVVFGRLRKGRESIPGREGAIYKDKRNPRNLGSYAQKRLESCSTSTLEMKGWVLRVRWKETTHKEPGVHLEWIIIPQRKRCRLGF